MTDKVLVIGAGVAGLVAIKACLETEQDVICYERSGDIGGLWNYGSASEESTQWTSCMKCTVMNTSKIVSSFSDFPIGDEYPLYLPNEDTMRYLREYAEKFSLHERVRFRTEVLELHQTSNGDWKVLVRGADGEERNEQYRSVLCCSGYRNVLNKPQWPGMDKFSGPIIHSAHYRNSEAFRDKRVLIVGLGPSAADCAADLSDVAKEVYLSHRRGTWLLTRTLAGGYPYDRTMFQRLTLAMYEIAPQWLTKLYIEFMYKQIGDPELYGLKPDYFVTEHECLISDSIMPLLTTGKVQLVPNLKRFESKSAWVGDGSKEEQLEIDAVILCTGYKIEYPFIKEQDLLESIVDPKSNQIGLYKRMWAPRLIRPESLAMLGVNQTLGSCFPMIELQARWAARVIRGDRKLPESKVMIAQIRSNEKFTKQHFVLARQGRTCNFDFWIQYMDQIAEQIGVAPNISGYIWKDPKLWWELVFGWPCPSMYRLEGPNSWTGARTEILRSEKRIRSGMKPIYQKKVHQEKDRFSDHGINKNNSYGA